PHPSPPQSPRTLPRPPAVPTAPPRTLARAPALLGFGFDRPGLAVAADAEEFLAGVDALQFPLARERVGEALLADHLAGRGVDEDAAGTGDAGDPAGEVDRATVVVARLGQGRPGRDPRPQDGELVAFGNRRGNQGKRLGDQRLGLR